MTTRDWRTVHAHHLAAQAADRERVLNPHGIVRRVRAGAARTQVRTSPFNRLQDVEEYARKVLGALA